MYNKNIVNTELKIYKRVKQKINITSKFVSTVQQLHYANVAVMGQKPKCM
jgi:hypothetical protein